MIAPKLRFKADDGSQFPEWEEKTLGDMTVELQDYVPLSSGLPAYDIIEDRFDDAE